MPANKHRNPWPRRVVAASLLFVAAWFGTAFFRGDAEGGLPPLLTVESDFGDVRQAVVTTGRLNPMRNVQVGSQVSGILREILVDFNSQVKEGQVLARLDPSTFEASVSLAEAEVENARSALELAEAQTERIRHLFSQNMVSVAELEASEATLRQAAASLRIRQHNLERARLELARCTIYSPSDGIVISRNVDVGQTVAASLSAPTLFLIADDLTRMQISANVSEADIGRVRDGQNVEFRVDAYPNKRFTGQVEQIRNAPVTVDNVITYDTIISVDNSELLLKPGMTAEVNIVVDERKGVVRVPNAALRARLPEGLGPPRPEDGSLPSGFRPVYRLVGAGERPQLELVAVRTGISDGARTEVIEGLDPDETLVTGVSLRVQTQSGRGGSLFGGRQARF